MGSDNDSVSSDGETTDGEVGASTSHLVHGTAEHVAWLGEHARGLLDFARGAVTPQGFGYLDGEGALTPGKDTELWITCRMTHGFSLGVLLGVPDYEDLVDHGLSSLAGPLRDDVHGGWHSAVGSDGPTSAVKEAYAHAFVLLATSSALRAGRPGAKELLTQALEVNDQRFWREDESAAVESWDVGFEVCEPYRGVNANMHTVEAYLAVSGALGEGPWLDRGVRILQRVLGYARAYEWRLPEHFDAEWNVVLDYNTDDRAHPFRPYGATVGHWFEWARLALHARAGLLARGEPEAEVQWLLDDAAGLFEAGIREGWAVDDAPGFVYTVDFEGAPVVRERMHWVVTEAIGAAAALHRATGDGDYADWYSHWWEYAAEFLIDGTGSWVHELDPENQPAATVWPGKPDIYHALQATLIPRLPLHPALSSALALGQLDA